LPPGAHIPKKFLPIAALLAAGIAAAPPKPTGLPADEIELGDAFVEAWLSLRRDMDSLSHGGAHPRLLEAWLASAPRFLARDMVRLSSEPRVVLAAAERLAKGAGAVDRALLADLEAAHRGRRLAHEYWALSIEAGDPDARKRAFAGLDDRRPEVRLAAARALAAAGFAKGRAELRRLLVSGSDRSDDAARALGAYGQNTDRVALTRAQTSQGDRHAFRAALGELALRRAFPDHHLALIRLDPAGLRTVTTGGQYDTWLDALGRSIRAGARTPEALVAAIADLRRGAWPDDDAEVIRRRLAALTEFLVAVNARLKGSSPTPSWPGSFDEAMAQIRGAAGAVKSGPPAFTARVAAAIAVLRWTADRIDHRRLEQPTEGLRFITPGGARAADGNLATSYRFRKDPQIVIELGGPRDVRQLWLALTCADGRGAEVGRVRVVGKHRTGSWKREADLARTRYFQRVDLEGERAARLDVSFSDIRGDDVACLAELRLY
jgi:hypothetical protein